ncbi:MAG: HEAT repeat domain-containing protein [Anaerolineae bacterium]
MRESFSSELDRVRLHSEGWGRQRNLADLSHPGADELETFRSVWSSLDEDNRYLLASAMAKAVEDDPSLNFVEMFAIMLDDEVPAVRVIAIGNAIESLDATTAARVLDLLRNDGAAEVRAEAATALGLFIGSWEGGDVDDSLRRAIDDALLETINMPEEDIVVRQRALEAFAYSEDPYVDEVLEEAYDSDDEEMRASAVFGMGRRGEEGWLPIIHRELRNEVEAIRLAAICASSEIGSATSIPYLLQVIGEDPAQDLRVAAVYALADFEVPEAARILEDLLDSEDLTLVNAADEAMEMRGSNFGEDQLLMFDYGLPEEEDFSEDGTGDEFDGSDN